MSRIEEIAFLTKNVALDLVTTLDDAVERSQLLFLLPPLPCRLHRVAWKMAILVKTTLIAARHTVTPNEMSAADPKKVNLSGPKEIFGFTVSRYKNLLYKMAVGTAPCSLLA